MIEEESILSVVRPLKAVFYGKFLPFALFRLNYFANFMISIAKASILLVLDPMKAMFYCKFFVFALCVCMYYYYNILKNLAERKQNI